MDGDSDHSRPGSPRGVIDWTLTPAKWGAVGVLALAGCMGLAWSVIRGEERNAAATERARQAAVAPRPLAAVPADAIGAGLNDAPVESPPDDNSVEFAAAPPVNAGDSRPPAVEPPVPVESGPPDATPATVGIPTPASGAVPDPPAPEETIAQRININTATEGELQVLPGIGPSRARAIIEDRRANGPFRSVDELDRVRGIGPGIIAGLREFARVR